MGSSILVGSDRGNKVPIKIAAPPRVCVCLLHIEDFASTVRTFWLVLTTVSGSRRDFKV